MIDMRQRIKEVLEQGYLLSLGTADDGGPWVADVIYVADDDLNIYWMSGRKFRHSLAIEMNPKVAGSITVSARPGEKDLGVQLEGEAKRLDSFDPGLAIKYLKKKGKPAPAKVIDILLDGYSWYRLSPNSIELIDQENSGFAKQKLELLKQY